MTRTMFLTCVGLLFGCASNGGTAPQALNRLQQDLHMAVTIDDLPYANRTAPLAEVRRSTSAMLDTLRRHRAQAIGFVNEDRLADTGSSAQGLRLLEQWLDAGMELGNHNYGHVGLQDTPLEAYQHAVLRGEIETRKLLARRNSVPLYYRHPFTQTGPDAQTRQLFESFLKAHGYVPAPFTIEHDDYVFSAVYDDALARKAEAEAARIRAAYLAHLDDALRTFETMSQELFDRQVTHILLIHANRLNADTLDATLTRIEQRGYGFVPLARALRDPAYASPDGYIGRAGPSWLLRWARGLRIRTSVRGQPDPEPWLMKRYEEIQARELNAADQPD